MGVNVFARVGAAVVVGSGVALAASDVAAAGCGCVDGLALTTIRGVLLGAASFVEVAAICVREGVLVGSSLAFVSTLRHAEAKNRTINTEANVNNARHLELRPTPRPAHDMWAIITQPKEVVQS